MVTKNRSLLSVIHIIVDAGVLYSIVLVTALISYLLESNVFTIMLGAVSLQGVTMIPLINTEHHHISTEHPAHCYHILRRHHTRGAAHHFRYDAESGIS